MLKIGVITGSTRPNRNSPAVAEWVVARAAGRESAEYEVVDISHWGLPLLDEPAPPSAGHYAHDHTKRWAAEIARFDGFVFVTPEYNHGLPAALKNAVDFVFAEWGNKAAGFVSYGSAYGVRAVEQLRLVLAEVSVATVRAQVMLSLFDDFRDYSEFTPHERHEASLATMLDQLESWAGALKPLRR